MSALDVGALRVTELRKELRARGLSAQGDKAELATRLRAALSIDELDLGALDEEHDSTPPLPPSPTSLASPVSPEAPVVSVTPVAPSVSNAEPAPPEPTQTAAKPPAKKIVLNRAPILAPTDYNADLPSEDKPPEAKKTRLVADSKSRLEMRAKRFGLPMGGDAIKEARKARFGGGAAPEPPKPASAPTASAASLLALKKRAERFGCNVSKVMVDEENKEKLERRKAKFGLAQS